MAVKRLRMRESRGLRIYFVYKWIQFAPLYRLQILPSLGIFQSSRVRALTSSTTLPSFLAKFNPRSMSAGLFSKSSLVLANVSANASSSSCSMLVSPGICLRVNW